MEIVWEEGMPDIQVDVSYDGTGDEIAVIAARGFIDTTTAPELEKKLEEQLALNKYKIVVDLKNIDYVSSAGWGVFVSEIREIRENGGDLVLVNMSPDVYDVYELMEFSSILKSFDSLEEAIANFLGKTVKKESPAQIPETPKPAAVNPQPAAQAVTQEAATQPEAKEPVQQAAGTNAPGEDVMAVAQSELGRRIIQIIIDNPYFEVKEIIKSLRLPQYGGVKIGGGAVKKELKTMGLLDKSNRFELALRGRG
jgi:anti-sigma B factor antagonist